MRLWHIDLIPYLPKSQLLAQWRELNSIFAKQDKHILINYIYDYDGGHLGHYTARVINEMLVRGYNIRSYDNYNNYFKYSKPLAEARYKEHNNEYLTICYYNLKEKYLRGQKDFTKEVWDRLDAFYQKKIKENKLWKN